MNQRSDKICGVSILICKEKLKYFTQYSPTVSVPYPKLKNNVQKPSKTVADPIRSILDHSIKFLEGENVARYLKALRENYQGIAKAFVICLDPESACYRQSKEFIEGCLRPAKHSKPDKIEG